MWGDTNGWEFLKPSEEKNQWKQIEEVIFSEGTSAKEGVRQKSQRGYGFKSGKVQQKGRLYWKSMQWTATLLSFST